MTINRKTYKNIFLFFIFLTLLCTSYNQTALAEEQKWVTDRAFIISPNSEYQLTKNAVKHEEETSNQLVTLTVHSLRGLKIEDFSLKIANEWGIVVKDKNNGILFLIAPNEREVRIEVGTGLENTLTDNIASNIIEMNIIPYFQQDNLEQGIINGHKSIIQALNGDYSIKEKSILRKIFDMILFIVLFPILLFIGFKKRNMIANVHPAFRGGGGNFRGGGSSGKW